MLHGFGGTRRAWDGVIAHLDPNAIGRSRLTCPGTASSRRAPADQLRQLRAQRARARAPSASCWPATRWAVESPCTSRWPRPSASSAWLVVSHDPGHRGRRASGTARKQTDQRLADELEQRSVRGVHRALARAAAVRRRPAGGRARSLAPTSAATGPRALAAALRGIGTGEMRPLWDRLGELDDAVTVLVGGAATRKFRCSEQRNGGLIGEPSCGAPGRPRLPLENPRSWSAMARRWSVPRPLLGRHPAERCSRAAPPRAPAPRQPDLAVDARAADRRAPSNMPSVARPHAAAARARRARRRRARPRRPRAGRRASRPHTPPRRRRARARPRRAAPRCPRSARSSGTPRRPRPRSSAPCSAAVSSIATRTATRSRTSRTAASPCTGSSTSSRPAGESASMLRTACSTLHAPLASTRSATCGPGRRAHRRDASRVVADPDLHLQAAEARARPRAAACSAAPARSSAESVALTGTARAPACRSAARPPAGPRGARRDPTAPGRSPQAPPGSRRRGGRRPRSPRRSSPSRRSSTGP